MGPSSYVWSVVDRNAVMRRMTVLVVWSQNQWLDRRINCVIVLQLKQNTLTAIKEEIDTKYILVQKKNFVKICPTVARVGEGTSSAWFA
jgi:hypothetical protein